MECINERYQHATVLKKGCSLTLVQINRTNQPAALTSYFELHVRTILQNLLNWKSGRTDRNLLSKHIHITTYGSEYQRKLVIRDPSDECKKMFEKCTLFSQRNPRTNLCMNLLALLCGTWTWSPSNNLHTPLRKQWGF